MAATIAGGADTALTRALRLAPCSRSRCWARSRSGATASRSRSRAARRRSCWCASRSRPGRPCAPTGSLDDLWAGAADQPQHAAAKVARLRRSAGRPVGGRRRRRRLPARGRARRGRRARACCATPTRRRRCSTPATTRRRRAERGGAGALPRRRAAGGRRLGRAAPGAARGGAHASSSRPGFAARLRLGEDVIGELEAAVATLPVPGGPVGAADHRALPGGPPGRRAGGVPARPRPARGRARPRPRPAAAGARAADPRPRTRRSRGRRAREPAVAVGRAGRPRRARSRRCATCSARQRLVEIVGPGGIGKTARRDRDRPRAGRAPGGVWLARLEAAQTADDVLDTVVAALDVTGGEAALLERLTAHRRGA